MLKRSKTTDPAWALLAATTVLLAACGGSSDKGQAAARVNSQEIPLAQVNAVLQEQRNLRPDQSDAVSRQILERLIDQELSVQQARTLKLDKDPRVVAQMEAAQRAVLARAYAESVGEKVPKPTSDEVRKYYADNPALFRERRIYNIQELIVEARPDQHQALRDRLAAARNIGEFVDHLKSNDIRFAANQAVRAAEQLPAGALASVARLSDGQATVLPSPAGLTVVVLAGSRSQPLTEEQAKPAIEQILLAERRRKKLDEEVKALRGAATIEYLGGFAGKAGAGAASSAAR